MRVKTLTTFKLGFCLSMFLGLALVVPSQADEYYTYKDPQGNLVISNKLPPTGSIVLKRRDLAEAGDPQVQTPRDGNATPLNVPSEGSGKPSKDR
jgi:Domain of unknown function (DUF4124)